MILNVYGSCLTLSALTVLYKHKYILAIVYAAGPVSIPSLQDNICSHTHGSTRLRKRNPLPSSQTLPGCCSWNSSPNHPSSAQSSGSQSEAAVTRERQLRHVPLAGHAKPKHHPKLAVSHILHHSSVSPSHPGLHCLASCLRTQDKERKRAFLSEAGLPACPWLQLQPNK